MLCLADLALTTDRTRIPLRELATGSGLDKATARRLLMAYARVGLVDHYAEDGSYSLGSAAALLAGAAPRVSTSLARAVPLVHELAGVTEETVSLAERRELSYVTVYEIESPQPVRYGNKIGAAAPLNVAAGGCAILAFSSPQVREAVLSCQTLEQRTQATLVDREALAARLLEIERKGYATSSGERVPGANSISAPLIGGDGYARGVISVLWPSRGDDVDRNRFRDWPELVLGVVRKFHGG